MRFRIQFVHGSASRLAVRVNIYHCCPDISVPQYFLQGKYIRTLIGQPCRKSMPKIVKAKVPYSRFLYPPAETGFQVNKTTSRLRTRKDIFARSLQGKKQSPYGP